MPDERRRYLAYLVRFSDASTEGPPLWRVSVEDPQTGRRRGFASLESLCAFFAEQITGRGVEHLLSADRNDPADAMKGGDQLEGRNQMDDHGID